MGLFCTRFRAKEPRVPASNGVCGLTDAGGCAISQLLGEFPVVRSSLVQYLYAEVANKEVVRPLARVPYALETDRVKTPAG